jgi:hypothetical protein
MMRAVADSPLNDWIAATRLAERLRAQELNRINPRPALSWYQKSLQVKRERPQTLFSEAELQALDDNEDFLNPAYKIPEGEIYNRLCKYLSFEYLTNNCCTVCERDKPKNFTSFVSVADDKFIMKLRRSVGFTPLLRSRMPDKVQQEYSLERYDQRLEGIVLSKFGLYRGSDKSHIDYATFTSEEDLHLCLCKDCKDDIEEPYNSGVRTTVTVPVPNNTEVEVDSESEEDSDSESESSRVRGVVRNTRTTLTSKALQFNGFN